MRRCESKDVSGCSDIVVGGTAVGAGFSFNDNFTSCQTTADGTSITIKNDLVTPTFQMGISFYKSTPSALTYTCIGPEFAATTPAYVLQDGFCSVQAQVHNTSFATNDTEFCTVKITGASPLRGSVDCSQLTTGRFYLSLTSSSRFSCQSTTETALPDVDTGRPSFVQAEVLLAGTEAKAVLSPKIISYDMTVSGCASGYAESFSYTVDSNPKILNLSEGDTGCTASLSGFVYKSTANEESFLPVDGIALTGVSGDQKLFRNIDGSKQFSVSIGSTPRSTLRHNELVSFYVRPPSAVLGALFYSSTGDFVATGETAPQITIGSFKDMGLQGGKRDAALVLDCVKPASLAYCGTQSLLDYRARVIDKGILTPTQSEIVASMVDVNSQIRPTVAHLFSNGVRLVVSFDPADASTKEYILVLQYGNSYRYFVFTQALFLAISD